MLTFTSAQVDLWLATFLYPLARIMALISSAPLLGNRQVPRHVKVGLSVMLTLIIVPTIDYTPTVSIASPLGLMILVQQILIGVAMGLTIRLIFNAVEMAGEIAGMQMGLGFATMFDPVNGINTAVLSRFLSALATLLFLTLDGHFLILGAMTASFHSMPVEQLLTNNSFYQLAAWGSSIFIYGLQISLPVLGVLLVTNLALGVLTRSAPQLNIFAVGFPVTITVGFIVIALSLPHLPPIMEQLIYKSLSVIDGLETQPYQNP